MVLEGIVEALLALQGTVKIVAMIALKLMVGALGMMTGAPLIMMMMTTTAIHQEAARHLNQVRF